MIVPLALRGLADVLAETRRFVLSSEHRRKASVLSDDVRSQAGLWKKIAADLPAPTRAGEIWMLSSISGAWAYKLEAILAMALRAEGFRIRVVSFDHDPWRERYLENVGVHSFDDFRRYQRHDTVAPAVIKSFMDKPTAGTLLSLQYRSVDVGRIALSNYLYRNKFRRLELSDPSTRFDIRKEIVAVQRNVRASERMLERKHPDLAVIIEKGLSPSAELFGAAVAAGIPVVQITNAQHSEDFMLKRYRYENRHHHPFALADDTWERVKHMPWSASNEKEILDEFEQDYRAGRWFNRKYLHSGKTIKSPDDVRRQLGLDPAKKTAVIFSHVLWDATFFYGKGLFEDYETWLVETVKAAIKNTRVNWVIKLHPDLVWKLKSERARGPLRDLFVIEKASGGLPSHVKLVPPETDIDTFSFFGLTDYCVTVRGTIGIEMACRGVPVVTGGTGRYSGLGFTIDSETREAYLEKLSTIESLPPMTAHETELARRFAHAVFKSRPWHLQSFEVRRRSIEEVAHPLSIDIVPAPEVRSSADFLTAPDINALRGWLVSSSTDHLNASLS